MPQNILLTGASGFLGANLLKRLLDFSDRIHILVRPNSDLWRIQDITSYVSLHRVDLENFSELEQVIQGISPSVIFHTAAEGVSSAHRNDRKTLLCNVLGTFNLLKATESIDYEYFLHFGGSSEYAKIDHPLRETDRIAPSTFYGVTKASSTLLAEQYAQETGKPLCVLRPFSIYGPLESSRRLIPTVFDAAYTGRALQLTTPGYARDYIYVEDVVDACLYFWKKKIAGEIINIGTGVQTTNEKVVAMIEEITGKKVLLLQGAYAPHRSDRKIWKADISKAKAYGWNSHYSLQEGLEAYAKTYSFCQHCSPSI